MKLDKLEARLLRISPIAIERTLIEVDTVDEAQCIMLLCPLCYQTNNGPIGTHMILCWFAHRDVPLDAEPIARWVAVGTSIADVTLRPSIHLSGAGCGWHGYITAGEAV